MAYYQLIQDWYYTVTLSCTVTWTPHTNNQYNNKNNNNNNNNNNLLLIKSKLTF